jgi:hypothetical protein
MSIFRNVFVSLFVMCSLFADADLPNSSYLYFMGGDQEMDLFGGRDLPSFQMEYRPMNFSYKTGKGIFQPVLGAGMTTLPTLTLYGGAGYTRYLPKNQYFSFTLGPAARMIGALHSRQSQFELRLSPEYGIVTPTNVRFGVQTPIFTKMGALGVETTDVGISFLLGIPLGKPRNLQEPKLLVFPKWDY